MSSRTGPGTCSAEMPESDGLSVWNEDNDNNHPKTVRICEKKWYQRRTNWCIMAFALLVATVLITVIINELMPHSQVKPLT